MTIFNFDLAVTIEAEDFESALSWLKVMPLERHDFIVIDYSEMELTDWQDAVVSELKG